MQRKIEDLYEKLKKIDDLEASLGLLSAKYDDLVKKHDCLTKEVKNLRIENRSLKAQLTSTQELSVQNSNDINDLEQYSRRDCLEIRGVPQSKDEDTDEIVKKIGDLMDVDLDDNDISVSHRLSDGFQTRSDGVQIKRVPAIIVKFIRRSDRDEFYSSRKKLKGKSSRDIGFTRQPSQQIYISESLTKKNRELFNASLKAKKSHRFKFIWTSYGKICLRRDANSPVITIKSFDDLRKHNLATS